MSRKTFHAFAGALALLTIAMFWISSVVSELFLGPVAVAAAKSWIFVPGLPVLILAVAVTGGTGFSMAGGSGGGLLGKKKKRMRLAAINGLLIMVPCAVFLHSKASSMQFDIAFYVVQVLELGMGAVQLVLIGLNLRDGMSMRACAIRNRARA